MRAKAIGVIVFSNAYTMAINLDRLTQVNVIPYDHFIFPYNRDLPDLARVEPTCMNVRDRSAIVMNGRKTNIFQPAFRHALAGGANTLRWQSQPIVKNRKIVRGEIPKRVYIVADGPEIRAHRVNINDPAEGSGIDDLLHLNYPRVKEEDMANHKCPVTFGCQLNKFFRFFDRP